MIKFNPFTGQLDLTGGTSGSPPSVVKYIHSFNNTSSWAGPSVGFYTITVLAITHGLGINVNPVIFELDGSDFVQVNVDEVRINPSGDITIRVPDSPDLRFTGKIILI